MSALPSPIPLPSDPWNGHGSADAWGVVVVLAELLYDGAPVPRAQAVREAVEMVATTEKAARDVVSRLCAFGVLQSVRRSGRLQLTLTTLGRGWLREQMR